jgi:hypothetical protein
MTRLSIPDLEDRSGMDKQPGETVAEYLRRVGQRTDLPPEDVEAVGRLLVAFARRLPEAHPLEQP